jgi:hypothetical protein
VAHCWPPAQKAIKLMQQIINARFNVKLFVLNK